MIVGFKYLLSFFSETLSMNCVFVEVPDTKVQTITDCAIQSFGEKHIPMENVIGFCTVRRDVWRTSFSIKTTDGEVSLDYACEMLLPFHSPLGLPRLQNAAKIFVTCAEIFLHILTHRQSGWID